MRDRRAVVQHHDFVGQADVERAEAEFRKHDRLQAEENHEVVREMAAEIERAAGVKGDGALGPEFPLRLPRSLDDAKDMVRDLPDALRDKARERLGKLPEPAQKALRAVETAAVVLLIPVRLGLGIAREVVRLPFALFKGLRHREA